MMPSEKLTFTPLEAARLLGLSKNGIYEALYRGEVPAIRFGRKWAIPRAALERLLSGDMPANGEAAG